MSVKAKKQTNVTLMPYVTILKDRTFVAVKGGIMEMAKTAQVIHRLFALSVSSPNAIWQGHLAYIVTATDKNVW